MCIVVSLKHAKWTLDIPNCLCNEYPLVNKPLAASLQRDAGLLRVAAKTRVARTAAAWNNISL